MAKVLLLAGEESGVLYAKGIAQCILKSHPDAEIRGYGDYGFETHDLAVMGFFGVLRRIFFFLRVKKTMMRAIDEWRPDVLCTIDYPGMNLRLAAHAKSRGIRTVHVVCPQVWAWRQWRIPKIEAAVSKLCCFFPFEPAIFKPGVAEFVGHPLAGGFPGLGDGGKAKPHSGRKTIAILPGSRMREIEMFLPILLDAAKGLDADIEIPAANERALHAIRRISSRPGFPPVKILEGGARELLMRADCAAVASGTATLEAALARCPTVVVYKVSAIMAAILRRMITGVRHVGLANVIWEKSAKGQKEGEKAPMPELLQEDFTAENVRRQLSSWLEDESEAAAAVKRIDDAVSLLQSKGDTMSLIASALELPEEKQ